MQNKKQYHWLTTGHVVFQENESGRVFRTREYNGLLKTDLAKVSLKEISNVQQTLFMRAQQEVDQTTVQTVDMVVTGLMNLGQFTEEEFAAGTSVATEAPKSQADKPKFQ